MNYIKSGIQATLVTLCIATSSTAAMDKPLNARVVELSVDTPVASTTDTHDFSADRLQKYAQRIGDKRDAEPFNNAISPQADSESFLRMSLSFSELPQGGLAPFIYLGQSRIGIPIGAPRVSSDGNVVQDFLLSSSALENMPTNADSLELFIQLGDNDTTRSSLIFDSNQVQKFNQHLDSLK